jgi:hypothetical protein
LSFFFTLRETASDLRPTRIVVPKVDRLVLKTIATRSPKAQRKWIDPPQDDGYTSQEAEIDPAPKPRLQRIEDNAFHPLAPRAAFA